jgi:RND family efflux transporter MFP subunit
MKRLFILPVLAAVLACGKSEPPRPVEPPAAKVHLAAGAPGAGSGWVAASLAATQHAVLSTRMAAAVRQVHVNEGQRVAAGTLLVSLADDDLQAGLKAAQAALDAATVQHRRIEALLKQDAAIPAEMDAANTQLAQAQAGVAQVRTNLGYTQIRAPFAGVVQNRMVDAGAFVGPGSPLVELEGQGALELTGSLSEAEAKGLKPGMRLPFEVDGQAGTAELYALATGGDPVSHRSAFRARVLKAGTALRSGAFARIKLPAAAAAPGQAPELSVPKSALVRRGELAGVFVARDGRAELRWLSLGEAQGERFPVRAGLTSLDPVIDQPEGLVDGQPVEVQR